jgi:glycosyltransferase involved in cell wall biosynthesis
MRWSDPRHWDKIKIIRCGLDAGFLDAGVHPVPEASKEFVCVARLSAQKGLPLLIGACDRLRRTGERFTMTIIGDGELREYLEEDIRKRELEDCVFLVGVRSGTEIREHLQQARTFVLPSYAEGLPVVLMEALALSRPVIATAIAGIPELVDSECGWLIPAGSEEALVCAMQDSLRASIEQLDAKGAIGRARVSKMHNGRTNAELVVKAAQGDLI